MCLVSRDPMPGLQLRSRSRNIISANWHNCVNLLLPCQNNGTLTLELRALCYLHFSIGTSIYAYYNSMVINLDQLFTGHILAVRLRYNIYTKYLQRYNISYSFKFIHYYPWSPQCKTVASFVQDLKPACSIHDVYDTLF